MAKWRARVENVTPDGRHHLRGEIINAKEKPSKHWEEVGTFTDEPETLEPESLYEQQIQDMTKPQLVKHMFETYEVQLDERKTKADLVQDALAIVQKAAPAED